MTSEWLLKMSIKVLYLLKSFDALTKQIYSYARDYVCVFNNDAY